MATTRQVYKIRNSVEDDRPVIDFEDRSNKIDWVIPEVDADEEARKQYERFNVTVRRPDALDWDYYSLPGTLGLLSQRALDVILPLASKHFVFLEAALNDTPYFLPFQRMTLDCLDRRRSVLEYFSSNPAKIMSIDKYVFRGELIDDPLVFCFPELRSHFLATHSVPRMVEESGLRGFVFKLLWNADADAV